jgi:hypothetical protein
MASPWMGLLLLRFPNHMGSASIGPSCCDCLRNLEALHQLYDGNGGQRSGGGSFLERL